MKTARRERLCGTLEPRLAESEIEQIIERTQFDKNAMQEIAVVRSNRFWN